MTCGCEVNYTCACGKSMPLIYLFFCKYCVTLRCPKCVSHEVDSYYCPHCLENIPSAEAKSMKNKCTNCLECPNCTNIVQVRSAQVPMVRREGGKVKGFGQFKKVYYLQCSFCFWTTRDINDLPDKTAPNGPWIDPPVEDAWMMGIINFYRNLIQREKFDMEKRKRQRRGSFLGSLGISEKLLPFSKLSRTSFSMNLAGSGQYDEKMISSFTPIKAEEDTEPADEKYYSAPGEPYEYASIISRINQPNNQVAVSCELKPNCIHLMVKRSQRCRECEHNLSKPEFNPSSIKFKIHQIALRLVPRFRIVKAVVLEAGKFGSVQCSLTNPTEYNLPVELLPLSESHPYYSQITAEVILPAKELVLAARDDTAQYDAEGLTQDFNDDPDVVIERRMNNLKFVLQVKPTTSGEIRIGFHLRYKYKNMTPSPIRPEEQKDPEDVNVTPCVTVCLGTI